MQQDIETYELVKDLPCLPAGSKAKWDAKQELWIFNKGDDEAEYVFTQKEIQDLVWFKPVYKINTYSPKVGDWVTTIDSSKAGDHKGTGWKKDFTFRIHNYHGGANPVWPAAGDGIYPEFVRPATPEEIASVEVSFYIGYYPEFNMGGRAAVTFGCQTITYEELLGMRRLIAIGERYGIRVMVPEKGPTDKPIPLQWVEWIIWMVEQEMKK